MMKLLASLTADAALTVVSCGIYPAIIAAENHESFTGRTLRRKHQEKQNEQILEALRILANASKKR